MSDFILLLIYLALVFLIKDIFRHIFNYHKNFILTSSYMLIVAIPLLWFNTIKLNITMILFSSLLTLVICLVIYLLKGKEIKEYMNKDSTYMNRMDLRFLISKYFEVILQQSFVFSFTIIAVSSFGNSIKTVFIFASIFSIMHLGTLFFIPKKRALTYTFLSFFGGMMFSYLVIFTNNGFWYSFLLHYIFYILIGIYSVYNLDNVFSINHFNKNIKIRE